MKVPYELEIFHRRKEDKLAPPELKKVHALGKSPVISVTPPGSAESITIAESGFITEYLCDHFANESTLLPKRFKEGQEGKVGGETEEWLRYKYYLQYTEGSLMPLMLIALVAMSNSRTYFVISLTNLLPDIQKSPVPFFIKPITKAIGNKIFEAYLTPNFKTHFSFLESQIASSGGKYLCGPNLTGADILMSYPLIAGKARVGLSKEAYPKLYEYTTLLENEPGYRKAADKIVEIDGKFEAFPQM